MAMFNFIKKLFTPIPSVVQKAQDPFSNLMKVNSGEFDQLNVSVSQLNNMDDRQNKMASWHEYAHAEINFTTVYGLLLKIYSFLSNESTPCERQFHKTLRLLNENSTIAHEVFATWLGVLTYTSRDRKVAIDEVLKDYPHYLPYYQRAWNLVSDIPSSLLRELIVRAIILICFQSKAIGENLLNDPLSDVFSIVRNKESPDSRFNYIAKKLGPPYFKNQIAKYIYERENGDDYLFLKNEINGQGFYNRVSNTLGEVSEEDVTRKITRFIYSKLQDFFNGIDSPSYSLDDAYAFSPELISKIKSVCPESNVDNSFRNFPKDWHAFKQSFYRFERERVKLSEMPLPAKIIFPNKVSDFFKNELLEAISDSPLVIQSRHSAILVQQYTFENVEDYNWLYGVDAGLTFFRALVHYQGINTVFIILFNEPMDLYTFLYKTKIDKPRIGYISCTALADEEWRLGPWPDFFDYGLDKFYWLNDISLLYTIEKTTEMEKREYNYTRVSLHSLGYNMNAFLLEVEVADKKSMMIFPCSSALYDLIDNYLYDRHMNFNERKDYFGDDIENVSQILLHIMTEEHFMAAQSGIVDYHFFPEKEK